MPARLPFDAAIDEYRKQAIELLDGWKNGDAGWTQIARRTHPRFLNPEIRWLPLDLSDAEIRGAAFEPSDAELALARWYDFEGWPRLEEYADAVARKDSPAYRFESAVEAVIDGDVDALASLIRTDADLIRRRSERVTPFDPPRHRATLLHYIAANGVEGYRQKTPANALEIARMLLDAGAEVDALADVYGGQHTTMSMLVSSNPPAAAGLQVPLAELLLDHGAAIEGRGSGAWTPPLMTALAFGFGDTADALVRRGARVDNVAAAAGLGRLADVRRLLPAAELFQPIVPFDHHITAIPF